MQRKAYTAVSRGWLGLFSLLYVVLLVVGGVGLGFAQTLGSEARMRAAITSPASLKAIQGQVDKTALASAKQAGLTVVPTQPLVSQSVVKRGLRTGLAVSANFGTVPQRSEAIDWDFVSMDPNAPSKLTLAPLLTQVNRGLKQAASAENVAYPAALQTQVEAAVARKLNRAILTTMMMQGVGIVYPMVVLTCQTAAIVSAILAVVVLLVMRVTSHSWQRWLRVTGRLTYVIALLAGLGALMAAAPFWARYLHLGGIAPAVINQLQAAFAPSWQHLAGTVAVIGFGLAGWAQVLRVRAAHRSAKN